MLMMHVMQTPERFCRPISVAQQQAGSDVSCDCLSKADSQLMLSDGSSPARAWEMLEQPLLEAAVARAEACKEECVHAGQVMMLAARCLGIK